MRPLPPAAVDQDDDLPPYDPPPGYRRAPPAGAYGQPQRTYESEALPPPGLIARLPQGREPVYQGREPPRAVSRRSAIMVRTAAPGQYGPPPRQYRQPRRAVSTGPARPVWRGPRLSAGIVASPLTIRRPAMSRIRAARPCRPQYGAVAAAARRQLPSADGHRPRRQPGPSGQGAGDGDVTSRLPTDDRPETGPRKELPPQFRRTTVEYRSREPAGTIVIDTQNTYLYLVLGGGKAIRYGIGVGREGFTWAGAERVSRMAEWPDWHPPSEMIERQPYLPRFMAGGEGNPLGARALYLGKTLYRIHGTNQPSTIGTFVSSGCIRLTNEDVTDLFYRVKVGTRVVVLAGKPPATASAPATVRPQAPQAQAENYEPIPLQPPAVIQAR